MGPGELETRGLGAGSYPNAPDSPDPPRCPVCGADCEWVYKYKHLEIVGCDVCLSPTDAYSQRECYKEY